MLQYPLVDGPTEGLIWYVAESDALRRSRPEISSADEERMMAETRRWVIRDLRGGFKNDFNGQPKGTADHRYRDMLTQLLHKLCDSTIEDWTDQQWESFTLQALWRVCRETVKDIPQFTSAPPPAVRHRDLVFEVTGFDLDSLVNKTLI